MVSHNEAVTLLPQYALARYEAAGELVRLDLAEEPIWAWETIIWPEEKLLKGALRAMVQQSAIYVPKPHAGKCRPECGAIKTDK